LFCKLYGVVFCKLFGVSIWGYPHSPIRKARSGSYVEDLQVMKGK
jgi:hypothetical protein